MTILDVLEGASVWLRLLVDWNFVYLSCLVITVAYFVRNADAVLAARLVEKARVVAKAWVILLGIPAVFAMGTYVAAHLNLVSHRLEYFESWQHNLGELAFNTILWLALVGGFHLAILSKLEDAKRRISMHDAFPSEFSIAIGAGFLLLVLLCAGAVAGLLR